MTTERQSVQHVLQALRAWGVDSRTVDEVQVSEDSVTLNDKTLARYKYFDEIEQPLFSFQDMKLREHKFAVKENGTRVPMFRPTLCGHSSPAFEISGELASRDLYYFLRCKFFNNHRDEPGYAAYQASGAFFQGGSNDADGQWFLIEFWKPKGVQAALDFINENYRPGTYDKEWVDYFCKK